MPQLARCVSCDAEPGGREGLYFTAHEGGLLCADCEPARVEKRRVARSTLAAIGGPEQAETRAVAGGFDLLDYYITETAGRRPRLVGVGEAHDGPTSVEAKRSAQPTLRLSPAHFALRGKVWHPAGRHVWDGGQSGPHSGPYD